MADQANVFISYARADGRDEADALHKALTERGIKAWRDERNLDKHQDFTAEIETAIEAASHVAVCVTPESKREDSFVRREIQYALLLEKPIIPLRFANIPPHIHIATVSWIDFFDGWDRGVDELLARLKETPVTAGKPAAIADDPYRKHVEQLNHFAVRMLKQTVFNAQVVMLRSEDTPEAVQQESLPAIYVNQLPTWFAQDDRVEEFDRFEQAFGFHEQRVLLLGAPGAGKTTTLLAFARDKTIERLADADALLPVYAPISRWDGTVRLDDWLARETKLDATKLRALIEAGRVLLLLDGLDELPDAVPDPSNPMSRPRDYRVDFMRALAGLPPTPALVSCRIADYDNIVQKGGERAALNGAVTLKPLTDAQIEAHLSDQRDLWEALQGDPRLLEMARTPLLLTLLMVAYRGAGEKAKELRNLQGGPAELQDKIFETYVHKRYAFEQARSKTPLPFTLPEIYDVMGQATMAMFDVDSMSLTRTRKDRVEIERAIFGRILDVRAEEFLELALRLHLLLPVREGLFKFIHLLLRDHFAVSYCLTRVSDKTLDDDTRGQALIALAEMGTRRAIEPLIAILQDVTVDSVLRMGTGMLLGRMSDRRAVDSLITALGDSEQDVRMGALLGVIFGGIRDTRMVAPLCELLDDRDAQTAGFAALALGRIGQGGIQPLKQFLSTMAHPSLNQAVDALTHFEKAGKIEPLILSLNEDDDLARAYSIGVLGGLGDAAVGPLLLALTHSLAGIRTYAATALMLIGSSRSVEPIIALLTDPVTNVRANAASVLGELGDARAVEPLKKLLNDSDKEVRDEVRTALLKLGVDPDEDAGGGDTAGSSRAAVDRQPPEGDESGGM